MSLSAKVSGVDYASDRVRMRDANEQGISGLPASANGTGAQGGIVFDDPNGDFAHQGWELVEVDESACTAAPRLCTGYLADRTERRGKYRSGPGREVDATILDINALLSLRLIDGDDGKRDRETRADRVAWIMGSDYLSGLVADLGLMASADAQVFDEGDFRGQYPSQVFDSISSGSIFFAYWDQTAEAVGMFFDLPTVTAYTSTLSISNDLADVDDIDDPSATVFYPYVDGEQRIDPSDTHSKHRLTWVGGTTTRDNPATAATFFPSPLLTRGVQEDSSRIGKLTTAVTYTDAQLLRFSVERRTVTCTMRLPAAKVGLIDAGMRIFAKFTHLTGFQTGAYTRIEERTVVQADSTRKYYDMALVLSTNGLAGGSAGGGGTGGFPQPPGGAPVIVQQVSGLGNITLPSAPTPGNTLVYAGAIRAASFGGWAYASQGFTLAPDGESTDPGGTNCAMVIYRVAGSGESPYLNPPSSNVPPGNGAGGTLYEIEGVWTPGVSAETANAGLTPSAGPISVAANSITFAVIGQGQGGAYDSVAASLGYTGSAGWTEDYDDNASSGHPTIWNAHRTDSGSITASATNSGNGGLSGSDYNYIIQVVSFVGSASTTPPPPTKPVGPETVTMTGDSGTTAFPFADGSLRVFVDNTEQTAKITSYDGATGDFTLAFTPTPTELVVVYYMGR